MEKIKLILYENMPCWYELSWKPPLSIILRIHKEFIENKKVDLKNSPIVKHYTKELNLPEFKNDFTKDFGFGDIFKYIGEKDNFVEFEIVIPQIKKTSTDKCKECNGTGIRDDDYEGSCLYCMGSGKKWTMDWKDAVTISATFSILTTWLHYCESDTSAQRLQLLTFDTTTHTGIHGGSLGGDVSIPMKAYLKSLGEHVYLKDVSKAMKVAHDQMFESKYYHDIDFNAYVDRGMFIINCPGDACGLNPSDWYDHKDEGFEFSCHNVDSAGQQLTLLVGLAVLCDMARKVIKHDSI